MKTLLVSLIMTISIGLFAQEATKSVEKEVDSAPVAEVVQSTKPRFYSEACELNKAEKEKVACAQTAMSMKMYRNISYPPTARKNGVKGTVIISYLVKKDGSLGEVKVLRPVSPALDAEAVRALKLLEKWVPATKDGIPVDQTSTIPVTFNL